MITKFGKALRKIRIDRGEVLKDMANHLNVSTSFLSAVEVGRKKIPDTWVDILASTYKLNDDTICALHEMAQESVTAVKINLFGSDQLQREAALVFARDFGNISDDTAKSILNLLKKGSSEREGG